MQIINCWDTLKGDSGVGILALINYFFFNLYYYHNYFGGRETSQKVCVVIFHENLSRAILIQVSSSSQIFLKSPFQFFLGSSLFLIQFGWAPFHKCFCSSSCVRAVSLVYRPDSSAVVPEYYPSDIFYFWSRFLSIHYFSCLFSWNLAYYVAFVLVPRATPKL